MRTRDVPRINLALAAGAFVVCSAGRPCLAAEPLPLDDLLKELFSGDLTHAPEIATRAGGLAAVDEALDSDGTSERKTRALNILNEAARHHPELVFTSGRTETVSQLLSREGPGDDSVVRSAVWFLRVAADRGRLPDADTVVGRMVNALGKELGLSSSTLSHLGYALLRLASADAPTVEAVKSAARARLDGRERRALLAAAGDVDALRALVDQLWLLETSVSPADLPLTEAETKSCDGDPDRLWDRRAIKLAASREDAILGLAKARDCRAVAPLLDVLAKTLPAPTLRYTSDMLFEEWRVLVIPAVRDTLHDYPGILSPEAARRLQKSFEDPWRPESEAVLLEWWGSEGLQIPGLDIRKSTDTPWHRRLLRPDAAVASETGSTRASAAPVVPARETGSSMLLVAASALGTAAVLGAVLWYWLYRKRRGRRPGEVQ